MEPSEVVAGLAAAGGIGAAAAAWGAKAWLWYWSARSRVRKVKKAEEDAEAEDVGIPWKKAWQTQARDLTKAIEGLARLTAECADWRVKVAELAADNRHCKSENERLSAELVEVRFQARELREEVRQLNGQRPEQERAEDSV